MNLKNLKDKDLELSFHQAVKTERKIMHIVILHLQEIARRKLHLGKGYGSLFEYLVNEAKYSGSAAQRRIEAAKLLNEVPQIANNLQTGDLNLSQICDIQRAVKDSEKIHQSKISAEEKASLVEKVLGENTSSTQQICAEALNIPIVKPQAMKTQKDKSRRIEITLSEEQFAKYEKVRNLVVHKNFQSKRTQAMSDILETMFDELLAKQTPSRDAANTKVSRPFIDQTRDSKGKERDDSEITHILDVAKDDNNSQVIAASVTESVHFLSQREEWKCLTLKRKRTILQKDQCCQYEDPATGKVCGSRFNLQIDHIIPKKAGGKNDPGNLRVLCRAHNLYREMNVEKCSVIEAREFH